tara:strand:+ start:169 stop:441 length:273 start_codon:yes stop_codon:yes gene_type:complete
MKTLSFVLSILTFAVSPGIAGTMGNGVTLQETRQFLNISNGDTYQLAGVMCFKTGEQTSGMNKICFYDCLGSAAAITVSSVDLCPLSINQ